MVQRQVSDWRLKRSSVFPRIVRLARETGIRLHGAYLRAIEVAPDVKRYQTISLVCRRRLLR